MTPDTKASWKSLAEDINTLCDSVSEPIEEVRRVIGQNFSQ